MSKFPESVNCIIPIGSSFIAYANTSAIEKMGGRMIYSSYDQEDRSTESASSGKAYKSKQKVQKD